AAAAAPRPGRVMRLRRTVDADAEVAADLAEEHSARSIDPRGVGGHPELEVLAGAGGEVSRALARMHDRLPPKGGLTAEERDSYARPAIREGEGKRVLDGVLTHMSLALLTGEAVRAGEVAVVGEDQRNIHLGAPAQVERDRLRRSRSTSARTRGSLRTLAKT